MTYLLHKGYKIVQFGSFTKISAFLSILLFVFLQRFDLKLESMGKHILEHVWHINVSKHLNWRGKKYITLHFLYRIMKSINGVLPLKIVRFHWQGLHIYQ